MLKISTRYKRLLKKQRNIQAEISILQLECTHPDVVKVAKSNAGNYDPSADSYWYEFTCPDCGKFWYEDQ